QRWRQGFDPGRAGVRAQVRPGHGNVHDRAGRPVLHGQSPQRAGQGQGWLQLRQARGLLSGGPALPGLDKPPRVPVGGPGAGQNLSSDHGVQVLGQIAPGRGNAMQWPEELFTLLSRGLEVKPYKGVTPRQVYQSLLDETARRAVWRAQGKPENLGDILRCPYTPLGSASIDLGKDKAELLRFVGPLWGQAVDAIYR